MTQHSYLAERSRPTSRDRRPLAYQPQWDRRLNAFLRQVELPNPAYGTWEGTRGHLIETAARFHYELRFAGDLPLVYLAHVRDGVTFELRADRRTPVGVPPRFSVQVVRDGGTRR